MVAGCKGRRRVGISGLVISAFITLFAAEAVWSQTGKIWKKEDLEAQGKVFIYKVNLSIRPPFYQAAYL
jgi:hypothetical protein